MYSTSWCVLRAAIGLAGLATESGNRQLWRAGAELPKWPVGGVPDQFEMEGQLHAVLVSSKGLCGNAARRCNKDSLNSSNGLLDVLES